MENQEAYQRVKGRLESKYGFYRHLAIYVVVCMLLLTINLSASADYLWVIWPLIGWGFAVFLHTLRVFVFPGGSIITEEMIEEEMKKEFS